MSKFIQSVAIYLRKSRLDEEDLERDVLETHRRSLIDYCKKNGWQYVIYEEVKSGESLAGRPQMMKLLSDIEQGEIFIDAVLVMDYDRLSRGDGEDQSKIKKTLARSDVFVVTYDDGRIYDLNNDSDDMVTDM
ncbi:recombinase family protein, partial [Aneurinibacillus thermoaerophilus]|nr:recombinase family protein [Aneurinibacillus thermoaerophilus]